MGRPHSRALVINKFQDNASTPPRLTSDLLLCQPFVINMKPICRTIVVTFAVTVLIAQVRAQSSAPAVTGTTSPAITAIHTNMAVVPSKHLGARTDLVLKRAKDAPGEYDVAFIGDSITQGWETSGKNTWKKYYDGRKCINLGVSGDRTEHVLWRFENGQLDGIKPKVTVLMIGTNNSNDTRDGKEEFTTADILEGVKAIVSQIQTRMPGTKLILCGIFPRDQKFSVRRGKILQVNQALAKLDDGKSVFYMDFGPQMIEADGSIARSMMGDSLHPGQKGYEIWASAMETKIKELLKHRWFKS